MAATSTINIRLDESLKRHGTQVLDRYGISPTTAVRRLYRYMEREQTLPECVVEYEGASEEAEIEQKRARLRALVGCAPLPKGYDARAEYRAYQMEKNAPGVRS